MRALWDCVPTAESCLTACDCMGRLRKAVIMGLGESIISGWRSQYFLSTQSVICDILSDKLLLGITYSYTLSSMQVTLDVKFSKILWKIYHSIIFFNL